MITRAFPVPSDADEKGMALIDFFAAHALAGYLASFADGSTMPDSGVAAEWSYKYAMAMMVERSTVEDC